MTHPTVDDVFNALKERFPVLSKATVYNTMQTLREAGIVRELHVVKDKSHYDTNIEAHYHFYCRECKKIYDIPVDAQPDTSVAQKHGHHVEDTYLYFYGVCSDCRKGGDDA